MGDQQLDEHSAVFVSYSEGDDGPLAQGEPGCVALLCDALKQVVDVQYGRDLTIQRPGAGSPEDCSILLVVLSEAYADSLERTIEASEFANAAESPGAAAARTFAVALPSTEADPALEWLKDIKTLDLFDESKTVSKGLINRAAVELGREIVAALDTEDDATGPADDARVVFLAHTDAETSWARDRLRSELEEHGFTVLPRGPGHWDPDTPMARFRDEMRSALENAEISIHLLGDRYHESAVAELGLAGRARDCELARYVWIEPEGDPADPRMIPVVDSVETGGPATVPFRGESIDSFATEILGALAGRTRKVSKPGPAVHGNGLRSAFLEALKAALREVHPEAGATFRGLSDDSVESAVGEILRRLEETVEPDDPAGHKYVYLFFERSDEKRVDRVRRALRKLGRKHGFTVWSPLFSDDSDANLRQHREYLDTCHATFVPYGGAPARWWHEIQTEWRHLGFDKLRGYYLMPPFNSDKIDASQRAEPGTVVMMQKDRVGEDTIRPFVQRLEPTGASETE